MRWYVTYSFRFVSWSFRARVQQRLREECGHVGGLFLTRCDESACEYLAGSFTFAVSLLFTSSNFHLRSKLVCWSAVWFSIGSQLTFDISGMSTTMQDQWIQLTSIIKLVICLEIGKNQDNGIQSTSVGYGHIYAFGKPAGHREVAPREFDVQEREPEEKRGEERRGEEEEEEEGETNTER